MPIALWSWFEILVLCSRSASVDRSSGRISSCAAAVHIQSVHRLKSSRTSAPAMTAPLSALNSSIFMSRLPTYHHSPCIQLGKFLFHHDSNRFWRPCPGTRTAKLNVGQLHVLVTGPREASRWLWMLIFKNIYFNILSVLVLVPVPGLLWTSLYNWGKPPEKPQPGKLTQPGVEPRPTRWEATMLPLNHSGGLWYNLLLEI